MKAIKIESKNITLLFKGFEIWVQETEDGVVVDIYHADKNSSTGLLGSAIVYFDAKDKKARNDEGSLRLGTGGTG